MSNERSGGAWGAVGVAAVLLVLGCALAVAGFLTAEKTLGLLSGPDVRFGPLSGLAFFVGLALVFAAPFAAAWWSGRRWLLRGSAAIIAGAVTTRILYGLGDLLLSLLGPPIVVFVFDLAVVLTLILAIAITPWSRETSA